MATSYPRRVHALGLSRLAFCTGLFVAPLAAAVGSAPSAALAAELDLSRAVVVTPQKSTTPEAKAVAMLLDEVEKRTTVRWRVTHAWPTDSTPVIAVGQASAADAFAGRFAPQLGAESRRPADGYRLQTVTGGRGSSPAVLVVGNDARGVLFGVGRLLRELRMSPGRVLLPAELNLSAAPRHPLRGHQLGYRAKTNSYDGWTVPMWEQQIRDLAVFGTNCVELIPPRSDDDADSPHFPLPPMDMMIAMSKLCDDYGLDVWVWYPALDRDYSDPKTVASAVQEWAQVFRKVPRIDAIFVPGGDPGHTQPRYLMALLEKQTESLHRYHPKAQMWVSPQGFTQEWLDEFYEILQKQPPTWLTGVVHGPQVRVSLPQLRAALPKRYLIRRYPDITHSLRAQYAVPEWDLGFALTESREVINPRPMGQATIFRAFHESAAGFLTYSEGCNDDVNKFVWSALGWDPDAQIADILRQYSRYLIGGRWSDDFAQGLLALERNWQGPLLTNESVYTTLAQFQRMERAASPQDLLNWRFQQALYRAYYDAYVRSRLIYETRLEDRAMEKLRRARDVGSLASMNQAEAILDRADTEKVSTDWRSRVFELGEALYQSIRMQLSVQRYKAIGTERGATLDTIDFPLNNRVWLKARFAELRQLTQEPARLAGLDALLNWADPGPGGFYDDLGNPSRQPHLVKGPGFPTDPGFLRSARVGFSGGETWRQSWLNHVEALYDNTLKMHYGDLDRSSRYKVRIVYTGDGQRRRVRLLADEIEVHPLLEKPYPLRPLEFDIPPAATADGDLTLAWQAEPGLGGNGRFCQICEVWLIKK